MELKLHSDEDGFKSAELVSATLPKGSVSSLEPAHSTTEAIRGLLRELTLYNMKESKERLDDWQREIMSDSIRYCFDVPELKYSREQTINGTGYGWQNSEGKKPLACCLGIRPFLLYGEPTLSSLADDGLSHSSAGIPLEGKTVFDLTNQFIKIIKKQAEDDQ